MAAALTQCAEEVGNVKDEYQDGLDALPDGLRDAGGPGGQTQEKIDGLESFIDSLEGAASDLEGEEMPTEVDDPAEGEEPQSLEEFQKEWLDEKRSQATDVLGELGV